MQRLAKRCSERVRREECEMVFGAHASVRVCAGVVCFFWEEDVGLGRQILLSVGRRKGETFSRLCAWLRCQKKKGVLQQQV